ncbi:MAG: ankyrin repeat domain-containing protein [Patescibacteria group bacterium]|nr:ankyrin repeat domain-containing protein [Patescibacteria group bacterium]
MNLKNEEGITPLMIAITKKYSNNIIKLITENKNFDPTIRDSEGNTYLHSLINKDNELLNDKITDSNIIPVNTL